MKHILDFYFLNMNVTGAPLSSKLNFSNKIILVSTIFFFYFIPFTILYGQWTLKIDHDGAAEGGGH